MPPTALQAVRRTPSATYKTWVRRALTAGVAAAVVLGTGALGTGRAAAVECPAPGQPIPALLAKLCPVVAGTTGTAGGVVGGVTSSAPQVGAPAAGAAPAPVTIVIPRPARTVPRAPATTRAPATRPSAAAVAPAPAPAPAVVAAPPVAAAPVVLPVAAAPAARSVSFDRLPTSLLTTARAPGALVTLGPLGRGYDPALLLTSAQPLRVLAAGPVTTASSAEPLTPLTGDGGIGMPVLLSVLSVAVVVALAVRGGVLRRVRRRRAAA